MTGTNGSNKQKAENVIQPQTHRLPTSWDSGHGRHSSFATPQPQQSQKQELVTDNLGRDNPNRLELPNDNHNTAANDVISNTPPSSPPAMTTTTTSTGTTTTTYMTSIQHDPNNGVIVEDAAKLSVPPLETNKQLSSDNNEFGREDEHYDIERGLKEDDIKTRKYEKLESMELKYRNYILEPPQKDRITPTPSKQRIPMPPSRESWLRSSSSRRKKSVGFLPSNLTESNPNTSTNIMSRGSPGNYGNTGPNNGNEHEEHGLRTVAVAAAAATQPPPLCTTSVRMENDMETVSTLTYPVGMIPGAVHVQGRRNNNNDPHAPIEQQTVSTMHSYESPLVMATLVRQDYNNRVFEEEEQRFQQALELATRQVQQHLASIQLAEPVEAQHLEEELEEKSQPQQQKRKKEEDDDERRKHRRSCRWWLLLLLLMLLLMGGIGIAIAAAIMRRNENSNVDLDNNVFDNSGNGSDVLQSTTSPSVMASASPSPSAAATSMDDNTNNIRTDDPRLTTTPNPSMVAESTENPTKEPTAQPTKLPTGEPTIQPTKQPTKEPTVQPTKQPTEEPTTIQPTSRPTTASPLSSTLSFRPLGEAFQGESNGGGLGNAVALSDDGTILAMSAPRTDTIGGGTESGQLRVFSLDDSRSTWQMLGIVNGTNPGDRFGWRIAVSRDGSTVASGGPLHDSQSGQVRVFRVAGDGVRQVGNTIVGNSREQAGQSVALSSDGLTIAVGADRTGRGGPGLARIFRLGPQNGGTWNQLGPALVGEETNDTFGYSIALSGDGTIVAVGSRWNARNGRRSGKVDVFRWTNGAWTPQGSNTLVGSDANHEFGYTVALSSDGSRLAVGAIERNVGQGYVRVFTLQNGVWAQVGVDLFGDDVLDEFGSSLSMSSDGLVLTVGATASGGDGSGPGYVRMFRDIDGTWVALEDEIVGDGRSDDLGYAVGLSGDGTVLATGARGNGQSPGMVVVYDVNI